MKIDRASLHFLAKRIKKVSNSSLLKDSYLYGEPVYRENEEDVSLEREKVKGDDVIHLENMFPSSQGEYPREEEMAQLRSIIEWADEDKREIKLDLSKYDEDVQEKIENEFKQYDFERKDGFLVRKPGECCHERDFEPLDITAGKYDDIDFKPPKGVAEAAARGLELRDQYNRGGTKVGIARARDLKNRKNMSPSTIKRMVSFFARHSAFEKNHETNPPSNSYISWLLWGGDPGEAWCNKVKRQMDSRDEKKKAAPSGINLITEVHVVGPLSRKHGVSYANAPEDDEDYKSALREFAMDLPAEKTSKRLVSEEDLGRMIFYLFQEMMEEHKIALEKLNIPGWVTHTKRDISYMESKVQGAEPQEVARLKGLIEESKQELEDVHKKAERYKSRIKILNETSRDEQFKKDIVEHLFNKLQD